MAEQKKKRFVRLRDELTVKKNLPRGLDVY